ncbi:glycosyltransferase [Candidatus Acetothermia bacterium]|nr:glycosyltransferase [Candidatus Acetothermia bacterium]
MTLAATVIIPTFDHGPTLRYSVHSALAQTVKDIEVFVIGDGVPEITREIVKPFIKEDPRVRFFDHPKDVRQGEVYRHAALAEARGEIVCYLSDDDLWLPHHIETMQELLKNADFAHALPLRVDPDGSIGSWNVDLAIPGFRQFHLAGNNTIPLSCGAHTMAMYRRLPHGWRTTPRNIWTDLYMWQQFFSQPDCRLASGTQPTVLHFPSPDRKGWTLDQRVTELDHWVKKIVDSKWYQNFPAQVLDSIVRDRAQISFQSISMQEYIGHLQRVGQEKTNEIEQLRQQLHEVMNLNDQLIKGREQLDLQLHQLRQQNPKLQQQTEKLRGTLQSAQRAKENLETEYAALKNELNAIHRTATWRLRNRFSRVPMAGTLLRWVANVLAGRAAR